MPKESSCVNHDCTIAEVQIDNLRDFHTYQRDFHQGPIWIKGVTSAGEAELRRQAHQLSGFFEDCPGDCVCTFPEGAPGAWTEQTIDIFGFGANGLVVLCVATKRSRTYPPSKCGPPPPVIHVIPHLER